jgi:glycosyltransferase involved in cell wall biosynthesis
MPTSVRLLFAGPLWEGSTTLQRLHSFQQLEDIDVIHVDSLERLGKATWGDRLRHQLRLPADRTLINERLVAATAHAKPQVVFIDSVRVLWPRTLRELRRQSECRIAYYTPDDLSYRYSRARQLLACDREWDVFFTTKAYYLNELKERGVKRPVLVGTSYDSEVHRPMTVEEVGPELEKFDAVFVGTYETQRQRAVRRLAEAGVRTVIYGNGWNRQRFHPNVTVRPAAFALEYSRALHTGRVALHFLRKLGHDTITTRSVEIPACARPMVAEWSLEHDKLFDNGREYISFSNEAELVKQVLWLLQDDAARKRLGDAARRRCVASGYSGLAVARRMLAEIRLLLSQ